MTYAMPGSLSTTRGLRQHTGPSRRDKRAHEYRPSPHGMQDGAETLQGTGQVPLGPGAGCGFGGRLQRPWAPGTEIIGLGARPMPLTSLRSPNIMPR